MHLSTPKSLALDNKKRKIIPPDAISKQTTVLAEKNPSRSAHLFFEEEKHNPHSTPRHHPPPNDSDRPL
jgi:hypothetical protein